jgi:hypothetical protein
VPDRDDLVGHRRADLGRLEHVDADGDGVVEGGLGLAAHRLPELAEAVQLGLGDDLGGHRGVLADQLAAQVGLGDGGMAQQHLHDLTQQAVLVLGRVGGARAGPGGDQVGAVDPHRRPLARDHPIGPPLQLPLVEAQVVVLAHVVEEEGDRRQADARRRELVVRRREADGDVLHRQLRVEQCRQGRVQVVEHGAFPCEVLTGCAPPTEAR